LASQWCRTATCCSTRKTLSPNRFITALEPTRAEAHGQWSPRADERKRERSIRIGLPIAATTYPPPPSAPRPGQGEGRRGTRGRAYCDMRPSLPPPPARPPARPPGVHPVRQVRQGRLAAR
jgi:hypothetical protein